MFSIEADEATDASNESTIIVNIRYINSNGSAMSRFLGVRSLEQTNADTIFSGIQDILVSKQLDVKNMIGMATDGASVMVGHRTGVTTQFKRLNPKLLTSHCMAHRLQLLTEKAANQCPYLVKFIGIINTFAKALKYSPKLCRILENCKEAQDERARKVKQVFFTRWLSFADSVQSMASCLSSVISAIYAASAERGLEGRAVLHGCAKQMATYKFVYLTAFLSDAVGILGT